MFFWLKLFHIAAVAVWFTGLAFLPRVFISHDPGDAALGRVLYKAVMTPAAAVAIALGLALILIYGFEGAWLPVKLVLVSVIVLLHAYLGYALHRIETGGRRHGALTWRLVTWLPLVLFVAVAALTAAKPTDLGFSPSDVHTPRSGGGT